LERERKTRLESGNTSTPFTGGKKYRKRGGKEGREKIKESDRFKGPFPLLDCGFRKGQLRRGRPRMEREEVRALEIGLVCRGELKSAGYQKLGKKRQHQLCRREKKGRNSAQLNGGDDGEERGLSASACLK